MIFYGKNNGELLLSVIFMDRTEYADIERGERMKHISAVKKEHSAVVVILISCVAVIVFQIVGALIAAWLVDRGSLTENQMNIAATIIRLLSIIMGTVIAWLMSKENKLVNAAVTAGVVLAISLIVALLFWGLNGTALVIGAVACAIGCGGTALLLSGQRGRGRWQKQKKRYR